MVGQTPLGIRRLRTEKLHARARLQGLPEAIAQMSQGISTMGMNPPLANPQGSGKASGKRHRFGAAAAPPLLHATDQGVKSQPLAHEQHPDAPRALELVGGPAEQIHGQAPPIDRGMTQDLDRIHMEADPALPAQLPHGVDRLHTPHLTLAPDQRHHPGWRLHQSLQMLQA
jgi:hypothetical protein